MSEISETEIYSMTKEQNYMRGYKDGREDERIKGTYGMSVDDIKRYFGDIEKFKKMVFTERIALAYEDGYKVGEYEGLYRKADAIDKIRAEIQAVSGDIETIADALAIIDKYKLEIAPQESDHKCHTCKHYTSGERDGSCGSYICKHYSDWESEDKE